MQQTLRPPRCSILNVATGRAMQCLINPTQLSLEVDVEYTSHVIPGLGHRPLQYQSTSNRQVQDLTFKLDRALAAVDPNGPQISAFRDFLEEFTRPVPGVWPSCPPRMVLMWPKILTVQAYLRKLKITLERFAASGELLAFTAVCTLETTEKRYPKTGLA